MWKPSAAQFYNTAGVVSVSVFFMLTGFLFWNKLLKADGRPGWKDLYIGRVFRLGPMYVVAVLVMIGVVAYRTGFQWRVPPVQAIASALAWLA
ncbi:acyltransferase family protein, partial [Lysobacter sp. 2RAB21]